MAIEAERLLAVFEARFTSLEKALVKARGDASKAFGHIEASGTKAENALSRIGVRGTPGIEKAGRAVKGVSSQVTNLGAQFNDIAVQLAGGQSPFLIAIQQGTQITQALGSAGAGGAVKALGGAFAGMLNPVGLATIAIIGLGGTAIQYFTSLIEYGEKSEETLKAEAALIQAVADKWGEALPALKKYADERAKLEDSAKTSAAFDVAIEDQFKAISTRADDLSVDVAEVQRLLGGLGLDPRAINELLTTFRILTESVENETATSREAYDVARSLDSLFVQSGVPAARNLAAIFRDELAPALALASGETAKLREEQKLQADEAKRFFGGQDRPLGGLSPITSGGGKFMGASQAQTYRANNAAVLEKAVANQTGATFELIKSFEGFSSKPYWDVNAYRAGYGSDTVTLSDGSVRSVIDGMSVSIEDANRDLGRRIAEFQDGIRGKIGAGTFDSFSQEQQAALTSIAYNYGSLPNRIVAAIRGGDGGGVYKAIQGLGGDNGGVNRGRRNQEADLFLNGSNSNVKLSVSTLEKETEARDKRKKVIDDTIQSLLGEAEVLNAEREGSNQSTYEKERTIQIQQALNSLKAKGIELTKEEMNAVVAAAEGRALEATRLKETEAIDKRKKTIDETVQSLLSESEALNTERDSSNQSTYEKERAIELQKALNSLKAEGIELTKEEMNAVVAAAEGRALEAARLKDAEDAAKSFAESQKELAEQHEEFTNAVRDAGRGFVQDMIDGKSAAEAASNALGKIADKALDLAFDNFFGGGSVSGGGMLGALTGLFRAQGGPVRKGQPYIVGEKRPEVFVPNQNGRILSRVPDAPAMSGRRGSGSETVNIRLQDDSGRMAQIADQRIVTRSGTIVNVAVERSNSNVLPTIARHQNDRAGSDWRT